MKEITNHEKIVESLIPHLLGEESLSLIILIGVLIVHAKVGSKINEKITKTRFFFIPTRHSCCEIAQQLVVDVENRSDVAKDLLDVCFCHVERFRVFDLLNKRLLIFLLRSIVRMRGQEERGRSKRKGDSDLDHDFECVDVVSFS